MIDLDAFTDEMADYVKALADHHDGTGKVGTVGYCLGGKLIYLAVARAVPDAGVRYYAVQLDNFLDEAAAITRPLMLHSAELDSRIPQKTVNAVKQALGCKTGAEIYYYPDADHDFTRYGYPLIIRKRRNKRSNGVLPSCRNTWPDRRHVLA